MPSLLTGRNTAGSSNGWESRHNQAVTNAGGFAIVRPGEKAHEASIVQILTAWSEYADAHNRRFESRIGDNNVLGPAWTEIGTSIRTLLIGELGRLDGGTLDRFIIETLDENHVDTTAL